MKFIQEQMGRLENPEGITARRERVLSVKFFSSSTVNSGKSIKAECGTFAV